MGLVIKHNLTQKQNYPTEHIFVTFVFRMLSNQTNHTTTKHLTDTFDYSIPVSYIISVVHQEMQISKQSHTGFGSICLIVKLTLN